MSITFSLPQEFNSNITQCPHSQEAACEDCYWAIRAEDGEFNVANTNGLFIVRDILDLDLDYYGEVMPSTVLMRLGVWAGDGVIEPSTRQGVRLTPSGVGLGATVINGGRSKEQVNRYISQLRRLAELAIERGCNIRWS